jgi:hypothetical protein
MRERTDWNDVLAPEWQDGDDLGFSRPDADAGATGENK